MSALENEKLFIVDIKNNKKITYGKLLYDINSREKINGVVCSKETYEIFLEILCNMLFLNRVVILDLNMTGNKVERKGVEFPEITDMKGKVQYGSIDAVIEELLAKKRDIKIGLFSSGTEGVEKKVEHTLESLLRNIKIRKEYTNKVWGMAYNPTHFAGIQVFLQALLNKNKIVDFFKCKITKIEEIISDNGVTNISATPTFYRMLASCKFIYQGVETVTFGGEKFEKSISEIIKQMFPNAKIINIYASTEAGALFSSNGEIFYINDEIRGYIKIAKDGELLIHHKLIGYSKEMLFEGEWYNTGDMVMQMGEDKIIFLNRKRDIINVGGYQVDPYEIEIHLRKISGVKDVIVYGRSNRITGNVIAADIVAEDEKKEKLENIIINDLKDKLEEWKIPRIIKFVENINIGRTGKRVKT